MTTLYHDLETYSETPIRDGVHRYAESAEITISAWSVDDGPLHIDDLTGKQKPPKAFLDLLTDPAVDLCYHNSSFDRTLIRHCWGVDLDTARIHDTMVQALAHGLPGSLDKLGDIFKINPDLAKDKDGSALIQLFCKPLPKNSKIRRATRDTHPAKWKDFLAYAGRDVLAMRELKRLMPTWNLTERERALWRLDQKINDRGFAVDLDLARAAITAVASEQARMKVRTIELTGGAPASTTQRDALLAHILAEYGVTLPDMAKDTLERRLADESLPEALRELLRIRLSATTTSTSKYAAAERWASSDSRVRGTLQFCGASRTSRWAGRGVQTQNFARPDMKQPQIDMAVQALKSGCWDLVLDDPMRAASNSLRSLILAPEHAILQVSDLANIEGRVAAWLAGEQWKLDAFAAYDAGEGPDLYAVAYAKMFGVTPQSVMENHEAGGKQRQIGKVDELSGAYQGSVGSFLAFAEVYRLDLEQMAADAYVGLPNKARTDAEGMLAWRKRKSLTTYGLSDMAYIVCQAFVSMWRESNSAISSYWPELEAAAKRAIQNPGVEVLARRIKFVRNGAWLRMILPGDPKQPHSVCYPSPRIKDGKISYLGVSQYTHQWTRLYTYGGKLFENACQALARDIMAWNMPAVEDEGFDLILHTHDELIAEAPLGDPCLTTEKLSALLATNPPWLPGCPLSADGFEAQRYRKS